MVSLVPIVEGHGEVEAVPVLLRRILGQKRIYDVQIERPFRVKRNRVVRPGEIERAVQQAVASRSPVDSVLVILDADDDCPASLGPQLHRRCQIFPDVPAAVVLATREFECWFLGAKESLRGKRGISAEATSPLHPEEIRGAKERLTKNMVEGRRYLPVDDQAALAEQMNLDLARKRCPSFAKLDREIEKLLRVRP